MIHTVFYQKDGTVCMQMQGHAKTAPKGEDLVCAASTTLAYTLAQAVQFLYEQDRLLEKPKFQIVDGYAHITARPRKCAMAEAMMTFWVAQAGAFVLERNYPQAVSLVAMEISNGKM